MAKNDVVKHDLTTSNAVFDWDADVEGIEHPFSIASAPQAAAPMVKAPTDRMITSDEITESPYCSVGKMQMKFDPLMTKGGSGWVVARKAFITAGHCVYTESMGGWIIQAAFCPRYDGSCPKTFTVSTVYTLQGWIDGDWAYDLAACVVTENFTSAEPPLEFALMTLPPLKYVAIGYPIKPTSDHDFNGKRMWRSQGAFSVYSSDMITAANDLTTGASGGPWLEPPDGKAGGVTSHRESDANVAISPAFLQGFQNLYDTVKDL